MHAHTARDECIERGESMLIKRKTYGILRNAPLQ